MAGALPPSPRQRGGGGNAGLDLWRGLQSNTDALLRNIGAGLSFAAVKAEEGVRMAVQGRDGNVLTPRHPELDGHVHCDVVQARGLLPADFLAFADASQCTSDPFVIAQLVMPGGTPTHRSLREGSARTGVRVATLHPIFDEELLLAADERAEAVRFSVFDADLSGKQSPLGFVDVPLPPRPPCLSASAGRSGKSAPPPLVQGWFPLTPAPEQLPALRPLLARLGRTELARPLGELFLRVSWGVGVANPSLNHRPPLRRRIARLMLSVHSAEGLPVRAQERPAVIARLEHQVGVTPHAENTTTPEWPTATFVFAVTEITTDLVLAVVDMDPVMGVQHVGEVIVPITSLLSSQAGGAPRTQWATILPPRKPGECLLRPRGAPKHPLGRLSFSVALELEVSVPFAYLCPDVPAREAPPGIDRSEEFSVGALHTSFGRVLDCLFGPMFAPLRTVLYLQTWQAPRLNACLLAALLLATRARCWHATLLLSPLWLLLSPFLNGLVSFYVHEHDPVPLYKEERAALERQRREPEAREYARKQKVVEAQNKLLAQAAKRDPSLAQHRLEMIPGAAAVSQLGAILGNAVRKTTEEADSLNVVKALMSKLAYAHAQLLAAADPAERLQGAFDWSDARLTRVLCALAALLGLVLSAALAALVALASALGVAAHTWALLAGLACFAPQGVPITRSILESIDAGLSYLSSIGQVTPLLSGSGLACTAPRPPPALTGVALQNACDAEARHFVEAQQRARQHELAARGTLRHSALRWADLRSGAWLARLLARAANVPRRRHLAMAARSLNAEKEEAPTRKHKHTHL